MTKGPHRQRAAPQSAPQRRLPFRVKVRTMTGTRSRSPRQHRRRQHRRRLQRKRQHRERQHCKRLHHKRLHRKRLHSKLHQLLLQ